MTTKTTRIATRARATLSPLEQQLETITSKMSDAELVLAYESAKPRKHAGHMGAFDSGEDPELASKYLRMIKDRRLSREQLRAAYEANHLQPPR